MTKKITLSILAILLTACFILSAVLIIAVIMISKQKFPANSLAAPTATETVFQVTPSATEDLATPSATNDPDSIDGQMDEIQKEVMSYRGLTLKKPLSRALLTTDQLKDHVINEFFAEYTDQDAKDDANELYEFGLLPANFDLHDFYVKLYSEQIAGYYDDKTKDMYVVSDEGFNGTERMTYAHEFTHVLQDQTYDMENGLNQNDDYCKEHTEYCAAVSALIEGDATLSEQYWYTKYSTDQDKNQINEFQQSYTSPVYDSAPAYMKEDFLFPYQYGLDFVSNLYMKNKWKAIDAAFKNPPVSTEQIMHPEKYPDDVPQEVELADLTKTLGGDWRSVDDNTMGEWYTYLILADGRDADFQLDADTAKTAAAGWGGDHYAYYYNDKTGESVMVWITLWDTQKDSSEFWQAVQTYGTDRWGTVQNTDQNSVTWKSSSDGVVTMERSGKMVLWMMSPSQSMQDKLLDQIQFGK